MTATAADGSALPGVTLRLISAVVTTTREGVTEANGEYRFEKLAAGTYRLTAMLEGLVSLTRPAIVEAGRELDLSVTLQPAPISEQITVVAIAPVVTPTAVQSTIDDLDDLRPSTAHPSLFHRLGDLLRRTSAWLTSGWEWHLSVSSSSPADAPTFSDSGLRFDPPDKEISAIDFSDSVDPRPSSGYETDAVIDRFSPNATSTLDPTYRDYIRENVYRSDVTVAMNEAEKSAGVVLDRNLNILLRAELVTAQKQLTASGVSTADLNRVGPAILAEYMSDLASGNAGPSFGVRLARACRRTVTAAFSPEPSHVGWLVFVITPVDAQFSVALDSDPERQCIPATQHCARAIASSGFHHVDLKVVPTGQQCAQTVFVPDGRAAPFACPGKR